MPNASVLAPTASTLCPGAWSPELTVQTRLVATAATDRTVESVCVDGEIVGWVVARDGRFAWHTAYIVAVFGVELAFDAADRQSAVSALLAHVG